MLWLYLLGAVTFLIIVLRRVLRRQRPLNDELYSKTVAIEHVQSGAAWVRADGTIGSMNPAMCASLGAKPAELVGHEWYLLFPQRERAKVTEAYSQMLLVGIATVNADTERTDGSYAPQGILLVAVHDHKMRFVGHHCLMADRTREKALEAKVRELSEALEHMNCAIERAQAIEAR
jgi:PAS domain S-box-containing protein